MIISNFIDGYDNCNYEIYLRDFINSSAYFLKKSNNEPYTAPTSEECGQCDCISSNYQLDFKLLLSETMGQGKREFSRSITKICDGVTFYGEPQKTSKDPDYKEIKATYFHTVFRTYNFKKICEIAETKNKQHSKERDIYLLLKSSRKPKNILYMLPYEFYYTDNILHENGRSEIISALTSDFKNLLRYRKSKQPQYDTYIAFIYDNQFVILHSMEDKLKYIDEIELTKSKTFQELANFSDY